MDLVLVLILALLLILITVSSSCGVKNEKYVVTGHNENANMLAEFNKKVEKFSNLREHFQGSDAEDSVEDKITAALTGEKKSRAEQKMDEKLKLAEKKQKLAELQAATAALEKDKTQAEQDTKMMEQGNSDSVPEFYRNYK
tara:strand:+ start:2722 stop:3144 length:423 start_codon:yes stop_codon:yes gene_type:complete